VRHDSGDPIEFGHAAVAHYENLGIEPASKKIIFSDGLNVKKALKIAETFAGIVTPFFGIGTHFTNDFASPALNMVIKLRSVNGIPVVKLSDEPSKATGDSRAIEVAKWTFGLE
jgi:nicotinate phosphoribosyltransferase